MAAPDPFSSRRGSMADRVILTLVTLKGMPPCPYALAVCLCAAAALRAEQQPAPASPDAEMNSAIEEFKAQTRSLGLRADSPPKAGRHSPLMDWHGRMFENFRNDALDAVPHEIRQNGGHKGLLRRNQFLGHPFTALMVTLLGRMIFFGRRRGLRREQLLKLATESLAPIASLLLIMGAGGAFKQIIVDTGVGAYAGKLLAASPISPLLVGYWSRPRCAPRKARQPSRSSPPPAS